MNADLSTLTLSSSLSACRRLQEIISLLKDNCDSEDEYKTISHNISVIIYDIMENVVSPVMNSCPEIKEQIEKRQEKYGRSF